MTPPDPPERTARRESSERTPPEPKPSRGMRFAVTASLVIAVAALGLAAWPLAWPSLRPIFTSDNSYPDAEVSDAKINVCAAYDLALRAVSLQTNLIPPPDASGPLATAANARLALIVASDNLVAAVDGAPAAPEQLQVAVRELAAQYRIVASNYLVGADNNAPPITAAFERAGDAAATIDSVCGT